MPKQLGKKIPLSKLNAAEKKGGKLGKRAQLAETARGFKHNKMKAYMKIINKGR